MLAFGLTAMQPVAQSAVVIASPTMPSSARHHRVMLRPKPKPERVIQAAAVTVVPKGQQAVALALKQVGKPYLWGSKGPNSFDCSGLVQWSYRQVGVSLGPDTYTQVNQGSPVKGLPQPGDLIFPAAAMSTRGPSHVVLAISSTQAVEAPGRGMTVRVIPMPVVGVDRRVA